MKAWLIEGAEIEKRHVLPRSWPCRSEQALLQRLVGRGAGVEHSCEIGEATRSRAVCPAEAQAGRDGGDEVPEARAARREVDVVGEGLADSTEGSAARPADGGISTSPAALLGGAATAAAGAGAP